MTLDFVESRLTTSTSTWQHLLTKLLWTVDRTFAEVGACRYKLRHRCFSSGPLPPLLKTVQPGSGSTRSLRLFCSWPQTPANPCYNTVDVTLEGCYCRHEEYHAHRSDAMSNAPVDKPLAENTYIKGEKFGPSRPAIEIPCSTLRMIAAASHEPR